MVPVVHGEGLTREAIATLAALGLMLVWLQLPASTNLTSALLITTAVTMLLVSWTGSVPSVFSYSTAYRRQQLQAYESLRTRQRLPPDRQQVCPMPVMDDLMSHVYRLATAAGAA